MTDYTIIKTSELQAVLDALQYTQSEESSRCICCGSRYECIKGCAVVSAAKVISAALAEPCEPIAWAIFEKDLNVYDCICNEEHSKHEGEYKRPLFAPKEPR